MKGSFNRNKDGGIIHRFPLQNDPMELHEAFGHPSDEILAKMEECLHGVPVMKRVSENVSEDEPAVSAHHVAAIIQRNGGHFSGWDVYNYLAYKGEGRPKCAERLPDNLRIMRYGDYVKSEEARLSQVTAPEPEPEEY